MKYLTFGVLSLGMIFGLASCNEESWLGDPGTGGIRLNLRASGEYVDAVPEVRSGSQTLEAPDVEKFSVSLEKNDGSMHRTWATLESFRAEKGFKAGTYTITAFYGNKDEEGFDKPYYEGKSEVSVLESREAEADITATLANSMVSVDYTDAFRSYFSDWSAQVHSEGGEYINFTSSETRPAFLNPGNVTVAVTMTNQGGKTVTLQPAEFIADARHHYHITFDVNNGAVGVAQLVVKFDDSIVEEDVRINLTEQLFTSPAPEVKGVGFNDGQEITLLEGNVTDSYKYQVIAHGGLQNVIMTINSATYSPSFGNELDLMTATAQQRSQLEAAGINCAGLWKNPDKMALVDIADFCAQLPEGDYKITLIAKDKYTRVSAPVTLQVKIDGVSISVSAAEVEMGADRVELSVNYNGENAGDVFKFKVLDNYGQYVDATVVKVEEVTTRTRENKTYRFTLAVPATERAKLPVQVFYNGKLARTVEVKVAAPVYSLSVDAFARNVELNVTPQDLSELSTIVSKMKVYVGNQRVSESNLTRDVEKGRVYVTGLKGATQYHLQTGLLEGETVTDVTFTTETEAGVPNGNFGDLKAAIKGVSINQGGIWSDVDNWLPEQSKATFNVSEPTGWATVNAKTFNTSAATQNTWFVFPSTVNVTESGSNAMLIRSVGYDYKGTVPSRSTHTGVHPYSSNAATVEHRAAGKLFLGSYGIGTSSMSEYYQEGVAFESRPSSLKGNYKFSSVNGSDRGLVKIELYNGDTRVASGQAYFTSAQSLTQFEVPLSYEVHGMKATQLRIMFVSSEKGSNDYKVETANVPCTAVMSKEYQSYIGSQLTVSNLSFNYGTPRYKAGAKKMVIRKK